MSEMLSWIQGKGIPYKNAAGGESNLVTNEGKINSELLSCFKISHIDYNDIVSKKLYDYLSTQNPGFYLIDDDSIKNTEKGTSGNDQSSGNASADKGVYLVFEDRSILKLGNNFLTK